MVSKIFNLIKSSQYHIFLALCLGLISFISYNLGRIDALEKSPLKIGELNAKSSTTKANIYSATKESGPRVGEQETSDQEKPAPKIFDARVVVSKASTARKYHHSWCPGAKQINEANKIWFNSAEEAEAKGYTLAGNCAK